MSAFGGRAQRGRCVVVVLDSVGIGEAPDAEAYGDAGSDTLGHTMAHAAAIPDLARGGDALPNLAALGLGNIARDGAPLPLIPPAAAPSAAFGRMEERAHGKDTATGHWEFMGLVLDAPFRTFPDGFPPEILEPFLEAIGAPRVLGNKAASGTAIIEELGREHIATGHPIVYTSADPVFQIAAHEDVVPLETLYAWCEAAYAICIPAGLSRVIARPFVGEPGSFERTSGRNDYALEPPRPTYLDDLAAHGVRTLGVGKIGSIYSMQGVAENVKTKDNAAGVAATLAALEREDVDFVFTNLVDFDMKYGHRRNPSGYARCLQEFDDALPSLLAALGPDDLLMITADHGNDPTYRGTDHTREYVPVLAYGRGVSPGRDLGTRATFADLGRTVCAFFGAPTENAAGTSFLEEDG